MAKKRDENKKVKIVPKKINHFTRRGKKILSSISPKRLIKKLKNPREPTGISGFDELVSGGLVTESINLVAGGSGSGKTIFATQFLLEGIKRGESVLYVTFEEKKEDFFKNMKKLGWDLEKYERSKKFIFLEYSPEKVKMMLDEGGGSIESLVLRHKVKRMVIDSITSFSLLFDNELEKREANLGLFDIIRKWDCTTLLTVQHDPSEKNKEGISFLEFEVDGIILIYFSKVKNKRQRYLEVMKMRGTKHSTELMSFKIGNGIKITGRLK